MKTHLLLALLILLLTPSYGQEMTNFSGKVYIKKGVKWYDKNNFEVNGQIVTIKLNKNPANRRTTEFGASVRKNRLGYIDVQVPEHMDVLAFAESLAKNKNVESVDINTFGTYTMITPNDPSFSNQWYLKKIDAPSAWDVVRGSKCVRVAILDSGTDWMHQDLGVGSNNYQNIWLNPGEEAWSNPDSPTTGNGIDNDGNGYVDDRKGWNFISSSNDVRTTNSHGTNVAGVVSAKSSNGVGIAGIAGGANQGGTELMPLCIGVSDPDGSVLDDAILYAIDSGAKVIQMSLSVGQSSAIDAAIQAAINNGVTVICAAGNTQPNMSTAVTYPASNSNVISVGATDQNDKKASFSRFGSNLTIAAPGTSIFTTTLNNSYASVDGTSFAAPIVSGVVALMLSVNPSLTPQNIRNILTTTADKVGGYTYLNGRSNEVGYGRVNAYRAVLAVSGAIIGPSFLCNQGATYQINNVPAGATVTWTASSQFSPRSGAGAVANLSLAADTYYDGTVEFTISGVECGTYKLKKSVWTGTPSGFYVMGYTEEVVNRGIQFTASTLPASNVGQYRWYLDGALLEDETGSSVYLNPPTGEHRIELEVANECGWSTYKEYIDFVIFNGYGSYSVYPNPAAEELNVEVAPDEIQESSFSLYNYQGIEVKRGIVKKKQNKITIKVSDLPVGTYFLHLSKGGKVTKQQIIIKR
jgi:subtilisin family serine protease